MPIHALLHVAQDIRNMGLLWVYWCFVMERLRGSLLPAVKSRKHPETSLANWLRDLAQNSQIELIYQLHDMMDLSDAYHELTTGDRFPSCTSHFVLLIFRAVLIIELCRSKHLHGAAQACRPSTVCIPNQGLQWMSNFFNVGMRLSRGMGLSGSMTRRAGPLVHSLPQERPHELVAKDVQEYEVTD
ncbi:hypothetical protein BDV98DRAFT_644495 [Pterulicium gracile]|uniref:Uncharacterized protein n=1 Tax=Pterulicium gracile TaxID=1884261 RepID=A0A5C3Q4I8_9AGAR|nr:hypothetical protein BDV98DRAFT_644495 [Pterula gracilis]